MRRVGVGVIVCAGLGFAMRLWVIGPSVCRSQESLASAGNSIDTDRPMPFISADGSALLLKGTHPAPFVRPQASTGRGSQSKTSVTIR